MGQPLKVIQVQKIPQAKPSGNEALELLATLCYYYPQYTLAAARRLPYKYVRMLMLVAKREEGRKYYNQVQIAAAPHTKNGKGVKDLSKQFKEQMDV